MKYLWATCLLISGHLLTQAQVYTPKAVVTTGAEQNIHFNQLASSLQIECNETFDLHALYYFYKGSWHPVARSHEVENRNISEPIIFEGTESALLISSSSPIALTFHLINCPPLETSHKTFKKLGMPCEKPSAVAPSVWRKGLPDPKPGRLATKVAHCVVHHSAGSNYNHDYVNVVRNIYLLHTQTNGWDDIGYNYLVAQDGTLFIGRDPQGVAEEDNIQGAHFCAKNSGTMGICLLGNYQDTIPTDTTYGTLKQLLVWKLIKENIQPLDSNRHPNMSSNYLANIAGHRDGCNTDCPGAHVYQHLPELRKEIKKTIDNCLLSEKSILVQKISVINKLTHLELEGIAIDRIYAYTIFNSTGQVVKQNKQNENQIPVNQLNKGMYFLEIRGSDGINYFKFFKY